jgi:hypothetical protein
MHTITGYGTDAKLDTLAILERANSGAGVVHVHALDTDPHSDSFGDIVDMLGVISARPSDSDVALKVGRATRYPGTHCRTCGSEVTREAVRELVAL